MRKFLRHIIKEKQKLSCFERIFSVKSSFLLPVFASFKLITFQSKMIEWRFVPKNKEKFGFCLVAFRFMKVKKSREDLFGFV